MDGSLVFVGFAGLTALTWKVTDFLRLLGSFAEHKSGVATQLIAWVGAITVVFLFAASDFGPTVDIAGQTLDALNPFSRVIVGLMIGSAASAAVDVKQAIDGRDTSAKPHLL